MKFVMLKLAMLLFCFSILCVSVVGCKALLACENLKRAVRNNVSVSKPYLYLKYRNDSERSRYASYADLVSSNYFVNFRMCNFAYTVCDFDVILMSMEIYNCGIS